jgi:hypothetical protein
MKVVQAEARPASDIADVIERLSAEFGDRIEADTLRRVASQEVALFEGAKVRTFVPMIAWRLARLRLLETLEPEAPSPTGHTGVL